MTFTPDHDDLNDSLADLIGRVDTAKAANPVQPPAGYEPGRGKPNRFKDPVVYTEKCGKCGGSGQYRAPSTHGSRCFECDGVGSKTFKTSPEQRAAKRNQVHAKKAAAAAERATERANAAVAFRAANPEICAWIDAKAPTFGFAASMLGAINQWGSLTVGQAEAVKKLIAKDANRVADAAARVAAAPQVDTSRIHAAFDAAARRASDKGLRLRYPTITVGAITISPAGPNSKNPGALYVKNGGEYVGKIVEGRLLGTRECTPEIEAKVVKFIADPQAAAKAYGQETGTCCICNATLKSKWKLQGIGPVCATKFGW